MSMKYINGQGILKLFDNLEEDNRIIISKLISSYYHLLEGIELLQQLGIIHNDLKSDNILYDLDSQSPKIIDFGISIEKEKLNSDNLKNYFYAFGPEYFVWPIEVHIINYLLHETSETLTEKNLQDIINSHVESNVVYENKDEMKEESFASLKKYIGERSTKIINELLKMSDTWDNYALSIMFIRILRTSIKEKDNRFFKYFDSLLSSNSSPDFSKRKSISETRQNFDKLTELNISGSDYDKIIKSLNRKEVKNKLIPESIYLETIKTEKLDL